MAGRAAIFALLVVVWCQQSPLHIGAEAATCARGDFEAVVDAAAAALRQLNQDNKPAFQKKLRQLRDKNGWTHDQFMVEAAPYVRDDEISVYDRKTQDLLTTIATLGQEGAEAAEPDCTLLTGLRTSMEDLVVTQRKKWAYMFKKLDDALAK